MDPKTWVGVKFECKPLQAGVFRTATCCGVDAPVLLGFVLKRLMHLPQRQAQAYFAGQVEYLPNAANELEFRPAAFREAELALPGDWPPGMGPPACSTTPEIETNNCGVVHVIHT